MQKQLWLIKKKCAHTHLYHLCWNSTVKSKEMRNMIIPEQYLFILSAHFVKRTIFCKTDILLITI